jgi:S1-C subfamily serine protease
LQQTGLAPRDVITAVDGRGVVPGDDLYRLLHEAATGRTLTLSINRGGVDKEVVWQASNARQALAGCLK